MIGARRPRETVHSRNSAAWRNFRKEEKIASRPKSPSIAPQDACKADVIFLAVPCPAHREIATQLRSWHGKIVVDVMNTLDLSPAERAKLDGVPTSELVANAFVAARVVKSFNHLPAAKLGTNPIAKDERQVVFVSSDDTDASAVIAGLATRLGFAPIKLGRLDQGGLPLNVHDGHAGALLSQNLVKRG